MRLEQYIKENISGRTKSITKEEAFDFIRKKCRISLEMFKSGHPLYRSSETFSGDFGVVEPSRFIRKSRYTSNYYTVMMDNMSEWNSYPKRSKSLIGASTIERAAGHVGTTYVMFPVDNTNIGVCPKSDLWDSFEGINADYFNELYENLMKQILNEPVAKTWNEMLKQMKRFDEHYDEDIAKKHGDVLIEDFYKGDMFKACSTYLDPTRNNFELKKIGERLRTNKEIWWSTKTVMIRHKLKDLDKLSRFIDK